MTPLPLPDRPVTERPVAVRPAAQTLLRRAEHVLFIGLLALGVGRSIADGTRPWWAASVGIAVACWYVLGAVLERRRTGRADPGAGRAMAGWWLVVLTLGWVGLVVISPAFVWLVFAVFLLYLQLLSPRWAIPAVIALTGIAIAATAVHQGGLDAAMVIGPVIGVAVAVVITVVYRQLRDEAERRAQLVADLTAAQARLAAVERHAGTLAERERLAHDIHDTVAQGLASILLLLRSVREHGDRLPDNANRQLAAAVDSARSALEDTRRVVRALAPAQLAGQSLADALAGLVADARPVGIDLDLDVDGEPYELPTSTAVALLRTAQGALGNVLAHSMARHARITLTFQPDEVRLDVADDGCGFDPGVVPDETAAGTGIGLRAMRTRLAEAGGRLTVESAPGAGTALSAAIPTTVSEDSDG